MQAPGCGFPVLHSSSNFSIFTVQSSSGERLIPMAISFGATCRSWRTSLRVSFMSPGWLQTRFRRLPNALSARITPCPWWTMQLSPRLTRKGWDKSTGILPVTGAQRCQVCVGSSRTICLTNSSLIQSPSLIAFWDCLFQNHFARSPRHKWRLPAATSTLHLLLHSSLQWSPVIAGAASQSALTATSTRPTSPRRFHHLLFHRHLLLSHLCCRRQFRQRWLRLGLPHHLWWMVLTRTTWIRWCHPSRATSRRWWGRHYRGMDSYSKLRGDIPSASLSECGRVQTTTSSHSARSRNQDGADADSKLTFNLL